VNNRNGELRLSERFTCAVEYVRGIHTEFRKGTKVPYMAHLLGVAALVMGEAGHGWGPVTEQMVIAALLHDAVEDCGGEARLMDVEEKFGKKVARMVAGLSDSLAEDAGNKLPWVERKRGYLERLPAEEADARLISVADKLYNARAILEDYREIGPLVWQRFERGRNEQIWYFEELLKVYRRFARIRIVDEFSRVVHELREISKGEEA